MKCAICGEGLGGAWFSVAGRFPSGAIHVMNAHRLCLEKELGRPARLKLDSILMHVGWVQESLPLGI